MDCRPSTRKSCASAFQMQVCAPMLSRPITVVQAYTRSCTACTGQMKVRSPLMLVSYSLCRPLLERCCPWGSAMPPWVWAPMSLHLHAVGLTATLSWGRAGHVAGCWAGAGTAVGFGRLDCTAVGFVAMPCNVATLGFSCRPAIAQVTSLPGLGPPGHPDKTDAFSPSHPHQHQHTPVMNSRFAWCCSVLVRVLCQSPCVS